MSRIAPVHYRKIVRILQREGFVLARERGDHMVFTKPEVTRPGGAALRSPACVHHQECFAYGRHFARALL